MTRYLAIFALGLGSAGFLKASPSDAGTNPYLEVDSLVANQHAEGIILKAGFNHPIELEAARKITNYSLREVSYDLGTKPSGGTLHDLDGDGDLDMVLASNARGQSACYVYVCENIGTREFPRYSSTPTFLVSVPPWDYLNGVPFYLSWGTSLVFADLNGDGRADLICGDGIRGYLTYFFRTASAFGFESPKRIDPSLSHPLAPVASDGSGLPSFAIEDLNGDQIADLIIAGGVISVRYGTGTTSPAGVLQFGNSIALTAGGSAISLPATQGLPGCSPPCFTDFDGDGLRDLMAATPQGEILVFAGKGSGTDFELGVPVKNHLDQVYNFGTMGSLGLADYSGDGDKDLIFTSRDSSVFQLRVLENVGGPGGMRFRGQPAAVGLSGYTKPLHVSSSSKGAYHDFDRDGKLDAIFAGTGFGLAVAFNLDTGNDSNPSFGEPLVLPSSGAWRDLLEEAVPDIVDFNEDGELQVGRDGLVIGTRTDLLFVKYAGLGANGVPSFQAPQSILPAGTPPYEYLQPSAGDINQDGIEDIVLAYADLATSSPGGLQYMLNDASEGFVLQPSQPLEVEGWSVQQFPDVCDVDGDGDQDIIGCPAVETNSQYTGGAVREIGVDAVVWMRNDGGVFVYQGGLGSSIKPSGYPVTKDWCARLSDLDGKGAKDLLITVMHTSGSAQSYAYLANPGSTSSGSAFAGASPISLEVAGNLPKVVELDEQHRNLALHLPLMPHVGSKIDFNDLYVQGKRSALLGIAIDADTDLDQDSLWDAWEIEYLGGTTALGIGDSDGDGLSNLREYIEGTHPRSRDTDEDGLEDGYEYYYELRPLLGDSIQSGRKGFRDDLDLDGKSNLTEADEGRLPNSAHEIPALKSSNLAWWGSRDFLYTVLYRDTDGLLKGSGWTALGSNTEILVNPATLPHQGSEYRIAAKRAIWVDSDADGFDDRWELEHYGNLSMDPGSIGLDSDNDGVPDAEDAAPEDPAVGKLVITIISPAESSPPVP